MGVYIGGCGLWMYGGIGVCLCMCGWGPKGVITLLLNGHKLTALDEVLCVDQLVNIVIASCDKQCEDI